MTPCLGGSQFNMKNPFNPEHSPLNQDPTGRNSMGSKFNPTPDEAKFTPHLDYITVEDNVKDSLGDIFLFTIALT